MKRLDTFIDATAERELFEKEQKLTVASVRESSRGGIWIDGAEITFPCQKASLPIIVRNLLGSAPVADESATPHKWHRG